MAAVSYRVPDTVRGIPSYVTYLACDGCRRRISGKSSETRPAARHAGWKVGPPKDFCPDCRTDR